MTAFIARNATESIGFIKTEADEALTQWAVNLSKEYISIPTHVYELGPYVYIIPVNGYECS
jgi:bacterial leucyl aminopeptidase